MLEPQSAHLRLARLRHVCQQVHNAILPTCCHHGIQLILGLSKSSCWLGIGAIFAACVVALKAANLSSEGRLFLSRCLGPELTLRFVSVAMPRSRAKSLKDMVGVEKET